MNHSQHTHQRLFYEENSALHQTTIIYFIYIFFTHQLKAWEQNQTQALVYISALDSCRQYLNTRTLTASKTIIKGKIIVKSCGLLSNTFTVHTHISQLYVCVRLSYRGNESHPIQYTQLCLCMWIYAAWMDESSLCKLCTGVRYGIKGKGSKQVTEIK